MVRELVPDAFWQRVAPLLPAPKPKKKSGRTRADDRAALEAIVFVLRSVSLRRACVSEPPGFSRLGAEHAPPAMAINQPDYPTINKGAQQQLGERRVPSRI
ncbi:transposase [Myxococcus sp. AB036A]|uniref:transposase n=1 Tax=Myxococcus sp. AB036A TaxID=2562793 RepID=UPI0011468A6E